MMSSRFAWIVPALLWAPLAAAQMGDPAEEDARVSSSQSPTMSFVGERYRIGVGIDTEFDVVGEFLATLSENEKSAFLVEGWLGRHGAGGIKANLHWLMGGTPADGPDGPVYTDGRVAKLFVAADQNQFDDRKLTFGGGFERENWFFSAYGMTALSDERRVNRVVDLEDVIVQGSLDGHAFTRIDTLQRITDLFEKPYDWGLGARAGRYFDGRLMRARAGLDYEDGEFGASQFTASLSVEKFFANTPHGLSLRGAYARKRGDLVDDRDDLRGTLVYSYSFGQRYRPQQQFREQTVAVQPEPRYEDRAVASEITLSDQALFEFDRSELRAAAISTLDEILSAINEGGLIGSVQIAGHTCDIGTERYNQGLSERRAQAVVDYLIGAGLDREHIVATGYGELQPRHPNDSEENRSRNRRVEISFVTQKSRIERVRVEPDGPVTEIRQVEVPVEAAWIRRALRNPVQHKRVVDYYRFQEVSETVTEGATTFENENPVAVDDQFVVQLDSQDNALDVLANDSDADLDSLQITAVGAPANGQVSISGGGLLYTPQTGFTGSDSFSYTIEDGFGGQATANVAVQVMAPNQAPVANDDSATATSGVAQSIDVLANDSDPDGDSLEVIALTQPANGTATIVGGQVVYQSVNDFEGTDTFSYTISDGRGGEGSAEVSVTVALPNGEPVANDDSADTTRNQAVTIDVLANDSDPDGDALELLAVTQPVNGHVRIESGQVVYQPNFDFFDTDSFSYTVGDGRGGEASAMVSVNVAFANQAPVANPDREIIPAGVATRVDVLANDFDPDGDPLTIVSVVRVSAAPAEAVIEDDGSIRFTISSTCNGRNLFRYTISDPFGATDTALVEVDRAPSSGSEAQDAALDCIL